MNNKKYICIVFILLFSLLMPYTAVFADEIINSSNVIKGTYNCTPTSGILEEVSRDFVYLDECFTRSSFLGCSHLEALSIQAAGASISWYGKDDEYELDPTINSTNIVQMLNDMEFEDVSINEYYRTEKSDNSMGVVVGHKTIIQDSKPYTLLAVIPRSAGYKAEWVGNFEVGDGDIHAGFKHARDEILRFVKQYIEENNINGDLKVWITGYSRGAAVADMLGGFFAGGGIDYFGEDVSITPEDVYCYTIGTPGTIKDGLDKNVELSVEGNRPEAMYSNDTPGEPFNYTKGGVVTIGDEVYNGLRNVISPEDVFPLLPPEAWGFERYGQRISAIDGLSSEKDMLEELKRISPYTYDIFSNTGDNGNLVYKTFDIKNLRIVETGETVSPTDFMSERFRGLVNLIKTNEQYVDEHYQDAFCPIGGIIGVGFKFLNSEYLGRKS